MLPNVTCFTRYVPLLTPAGRQLKYAKVDANATGVWPVQTWQLTAYDEVSRAQLASARAGSLDSNNEMFLELVNTLKSKGYCMRKDAFNKLQNVLFLKLDGAEIFGSAW